MTATALTPSSDRRLATHTYPIDYQKKLEWFRQRQEKLETGNVMYAWDLGNWFVDLDHNEAKYGQHASADAALQLDLVDGPGVVSMHKVREYKAFATTFTRDFIAAEAAIRANDGKMLSLHHWLALATIKDTKQRNKMIRQARDTGVSVRELEIIISNAGMQAEHHRRGGRKPVMPKNPIVALQRARNLAKQFANWVVACDKAAFDKFDHLSPENVSDKLVEQLQEAKQQIDSAGEAVEQAKLRLDSNIAYAQAVIAKRDEPVDKNGKPGKAGKASHGKNGRHHTTARRR